MITLYIKSNCPYSKKAIEGLKEQGVSYTEKNISDPVVLQELLGHGGKRQVPFLEDDNMTPYLIDDDVEMYESDAIVEYVRTKYGGENPGTKGASAHRLHVMEDSTCEACE